LLKQLGSWRFEGLNRVDIEVMIYDLYLSTQGDDCRALADYILASGIDVAGIDESCYKELTANIIESAQTQRDLIIVPRKFVAFSADTAHDSIGSFKRDALVSYYIRDVDTARKIAKMRREVVILLTPDNSRVVDEHQVRFMATSKYAKYIEVAAVPLVRYLHNCTVKSCLSTIESIRETLHRAVQEGLGVVISSVGKIKNNEYEVLHPNAFRAVLRVLGLNETEIKLILRVNPAELLELWIRRGQKK